MKWVREAQEIDESPSLVRIELLSGILPNPDGHIFDSGGVSVRPDRRHRVVRVGQCRHPAPDVDRFPSPRVRRGPFPSNLS